MKLSANYRKKPSEAAYLRWSAIRSVDYSLVEAAESMGASKRRTFFTVIVPSAVSNIFTGARLGLSGAIICIVAAEMLAASEGLGYLIYTSRLYYRTDWIFAAKLSYRYR